MNKLYFIYKHTW